MTSKDSLYANLHALRVPQDAIDYLIALWDVIQFFDDVADNPADVQRKDTDIALWNVLVGMQMNTFYARHQAHLLPMIGNAILKWQGSDKAERNGDVGAKTFVWRASFYDIVLTVVQLCNGPQFAMDNADIVMNLYGEDYEEYLKEFA